jgi:hypothetical protein
LILTVLEQPEAMRILAGGDARRTRLAAGLLGAGAILILGAFAWTAVTALLPAVVKIVPGAGWLVSSALAATAEPSIATGGDPRSNGQGPGLVGTRGHAGLRPVHRPGARREADRTTTGPPRCCPAEPPPPLTGLVGRNVTARILRPWPAGRRDRRPRASGRSARG